MYRQSSGSRSLAFWSARTRGFFALGAEGEPKMAEQESAAVRNANKHFRKEEQAREGAAAWKEYLEQEDATRLKTARLRALRLARDAAAANNPTPPRKQAVRASAAKR